MFRPKKVRLTLEMSKEMNQTLIRLATRLDTSYAEVLRRGIALIDVAVDAKPRGLRIGLADEGAEYIHTRILV